MSSDNPLIVFEGIDGAGKATQVALLVKRLRKNGHTVAVFDFPRYNTSIGKFIRENLNGTYGDFVRMSPYLAAIPYALDRGAAQKSIRAALKKGIVICNRYTESNVAFQGAKLPAVSRAKFKKFIETIEYDDLKVPRPDLTILLSTPVKIAQEFIVSSRGTKDQHEADLAYQKRVAALYSILAKGKGWVRIDTAKRGTFRGTEELHEAVWKAVEKKIG